MSLRKQKNIYKLPIFCFMMKKAGDEDATVQEDTNNMEQTNTVGREVRIA